jgi:hypothetical protein
MKNLSVALVGSYIQPTKNFAIPQQYIARIVAGWLLGHLFTSHV